MDLFETLYAKRKRRVKSRSLEHIYYREHSLTLLKYPFFNKYISRDKEFSIIQSNIILRALKNKEKIDKAIVTYVNECKSKNIKVDKNVLREKVDYVLCDLPYVNDDDNHRIYIPFFSKSLNIIYVDEPEKLLKYPYNELLTNFSSSVIDPFEEYNYKLYDSFFSKMIRSRSDEKTTAFFNVDDYVIYVITEQGKLDKSIYLFDHHCFRFNLKELMIRVNKLMDVYYLYNQNNFMVELYKQRFISYTMYKYLIGRI